MLTLLLLEKCRVQGLGSDFMKERKKHRMADEYQQ